MNEAERILANMPPDEREALLSRLRDILTPKAKTVRDVPAPDLRRYWRISTEEFECVVSNQDARDLTQAIDVANQTLTPWYRRPNLVCDHARKIEHLNHSQYVDWLRRS